jgi:hypothetical protein
MNMSSREGRSFFTYMLEGDSLVAARKLAETGDLRHLGTIQSNNILAAAIEDHRNNLRNIEANSKAEAAARAAADAAEQRADRLEAEARRVADELYGDEDIFAEPLRGSDESVDDFVKRI